MGIRLIEGRIGRSCGPSMLPKSHPLMSTFQKYFHGGATPEWSSSPNQRDACALTSCPSRLESCPISLDKRQFESSPSLWCQLISYLSILNLVIDWFSHRKWKFLGLQLHVRGTQLAELEWMGIERSESSPSCCWYPSGEWKRSVSMAWQSASADSWSSSWHLGSEAQCAKLHASPCSHSSSQRDLGILVDSVATACFTWHHPSWVPSRSCNSRSPHHDPLQNAEFSCLSLGSVGRSWENAYDDL